MDCRPIFKKARAAGIRAGLLDESVINMILMNVADVAIDRTEFLLAENRKDLDKMYRQDPNYDRLLLTPERIGVIASEIRNVAALPSPAGRTISRETRPNGLVISRISVPFGLIGIIYEARPNVTFDVFFTLSQIW